MGMSLERRGYVAMNIVEYFEAAEDLATHQGLARHRDQPERTGPIADVLYCAASDNSADDMWYRKGIISYSFETGADRVGESPTRQAQLGRRPAIAFKKSTQAAERPADRTAGALAKPRAGTRGHDSSSRPATEVCLESAYGLAKTCRARA